MIDPSLFTGYFNAFLMLLKNSILNRISYNAATPPTFFRR